MGSEIILHVEKTDSEGKKKAIKIPLKSISLELKNNIFNLGEVEPDFSFPFEIPCTPQNILFFGYPHEISRRGKHFGEFPAHLEIFGTLYKAGIFTLMSANSQNYKGNFKTKTSDISELKNQNIREILKNELYDIGGTSLETLDKFAETNSYPITFPVMEFGTKTVNDYDDGYQTKPTESKTNRLFSYFVPCFRLSYIIKRIFETVGYKEKGNFASYQNINKVILINNVPMKTFKVPENIEDYFLSIGETLAGQYDVTEVTYIYSFARRIPVKNHIPDMSLKAFIEAFRKIFGAVFLFDSLRKNYEIKFYEELITEQKETDWTYKTSPKITISGLEYEGFKFAFAENNDPYRASLGDNMDNFDRITTAESLADSNLPAPNTMPNQIFTNRRDNWVYISRQDLGTENYGYFKTSNSDLTYETGEAVHEIKTDFSPIVMDNGKQYFTGDLAFLEANIREDEVDIGSGNVFKYIRLTFNFNIILNLERDIFEVRLRGSSVYDTDKWFRVITGDTSPSAAPAWLRINAEFIENEDNISFEWRARNWRLFPRLGYDITDEKGEGFSPMLALYHGLQPDQNNSNPYPFASSSNFNARGTAMGGWALRWKFTDNDTDNLFDVFFKDFDDFFKQRNEVKTSHNLNFTDLKFFNPVQKVRIKDTLFFVKKLSVNISKSGIKPTSAVLWKLGATECKHEIRIETYKDCNHEVAFQVYSKD